MKGKMIPPIPEEYRKRIEELTLADDIGFMRGFDGNIEGTEHLVRTLTGRDDITVISVQAQKHLSSIGSHSVILDIFAEGKDGEQIAMNLIRKGLSMPLIADSTGLSVEEVEKLAERIRGQRK